jgi:hypothetical protein
MIFEAEKKPGVGSSRTDIESDVAEPSHRVRLPRFIVTEPVGLGAVVKRITSAAGLRPCEPCEQRAARLNRWLQIDPR